MIDPIMSIGVAVFILVNACRNLRSILDLFLEKTPDGIDVHEISSHIAEIEGILDVHHIHIWSMDGQNNYATMHIVTDSDPHRIKENVREELLEHGIGHATLELEAKGEQCHARTCHVETGTHACGHHHHGHGHHHH